MDATHVSRVERLSDHGKGPSVAVTVADRSLRPFSHHRLLGVLLLLLLVLLLASLSPVISVMQ